MGVADSTLTTQISIPASEISFSSAYPEELEKFFESLQMCPVGTDHFKDLEKDHTVTEPASAIRSMQGRRAPGWMSRAALSITTVSV